MAAATKTDEKKEYVAPKVIHTEVLQSRAVSCALADEAQCSGGPIQS